MQDISNLPRTTKFVIVFATDVVVLLFAFWMASGFGLNYLGQDYWAVGDLTSAHWAGIATIVGSVVILARFRLYRIRLHAHDVDAVRKTALAALSIGVFSAVVAFFLEPGFARTLPALFGVCFFALAVAVRILALQVLRQIAFYSNQRTAVAVYGAGSTGIQLAASLKQSDTLKPVMFVDDNSALHDLVVSGIRVKSKATLKKALGERRVEQVLIAIPSLPIARKRALVTELKECGAEVKTIPSYDDLVTGIDTPDNLQAIDVDELLERDKVELQSPAITLAYAKRSVMVTGAGGSIAAELCQQILLCQPSCLVLFERSELALFDIEYRLRPIASELGVSLVPVLGSVTDRPAVDAALEQASVDIILHAAAYKHVPLLETNEVEAARNNVLGTQTVVDAAMEANLERFILISTDKAIRPANVMGATKRLAELVVQDAQQRTSSTLFSMVRFGNVLGSSGSVVPLFAQQIAEGGPVTVTDREATRYFMTIPEAASLVLLAGAFAQGDELFALDMGQPLPILDLAKRMIQLSGRQVRQSGDDGGIAIEITGLRAGEKLSEELMFPGESVEATDHPKINRIVSPVDLNADLTTMIARLQSAVEGRDDQAVRTLAQDYVEDFGPARETSPVIPFPGSRQSA